MKNLVLIVSCMAFGLSYGQHLWSLERCIAHARENNIDVVAQKLENLKNEQDLTAAKLDRFPDLNFNASQSYRLGSSFDVSTGIGQQESRSSNFSLNSTLVLFNGFRKNVSIQQAELIQQKGLAESERIIYETVLQITDLYLEVLLNKEILEVAKEQQEISDKQIIRLQALFDKGLVSKSELLEFQSTNSLDYKEAILAQTNVDNSLIRLKELLDIEDIVDFDISPLDQVEDGTLLSDTPDQLFDQAVRNNPILRSSELQTQISEKQVRIERSSFYPQLSFNYNFSTFYFGILGQDDVIFNPDTGTFINNDFWTQLDNNKINFIGFTASVPIFDRLRGRSAVKKAMIDFDINQKVYENQKKELKNRISIALNDIEAAIAGKEATARGLEAQLEAFRIITRNYERGNFTSHDFLESKSKLARAQSEEIRAKYELVIKKKYLEFLIGLPLAFD